jgi:hypothetical protein
MRILVFCPTHPKTPKLYGRTNQSIFRQTYEPLDIMFSQGDNPYKGEDPDIGRRNILHNYKKAARFAIRNRYDYLMTVEYDMVIPADAVAKLLECDADVAYGLYVFRGRAKWSAYLALSRTMGQSLSEDPEYAREMWGKRVIVAGVGFGCTLIARRVLENIPFRLAPGAANDWHFAIDVQGHGYQQVCDTSVVCGHITTNPSPRVIWPDIDMPKFYRNDFIDSIPVNENGEVEVEIGQLGEFYIPKSALAVPVGE